MLKSHRFSNNTYVVIILFIIIIFFFRNVFVNHSIGNNIVPRLVLKSRNLRICGRFIIRLQNSRRRTLAYYRGINCVKPIEFTSKLFRFIILIDDR